MKNLLAILAFVCLYAATSCQQKNTQTSQVQLITTDEMNALIEMQDVQIIDVRTQAEYQSGHLFYAENIDVNSPEFEALIENLNKDKPICVYCKSGGRSAKAAKILEQKGFKKVYDLKGGIVKWQKDGKEIQTAIPEPPTSE